MRSCLILGSGRSGTSLLAGILAGAGYFQGDDLYPPRDANPKGFFEDLEINRINERLLAGVVPPRPRGPLGAVFSDRPAQWQRWLAAVPVETPMTAAGPLEDRMRHQTSRTPFCFKDPRFCYTLPAWRAHLGGAAFLCVFRHPVATVRSILEERRNAPYLHDLRLGFRRALRVWTLMYRHVLEVHAESGDWLFVHYEQLLDRSAAPPVAHLLGVEGNWDFVDPSLNRSRSEGRFDGPAAEVYAELCRRASFRGVADRPALRLA